MHILSRKKHKNDSKFTPFKMYAQSKITVINRDEVIVEGCTGVNEYYSNIISLKIPGGRFNISGKNLSIAAFDENAFIVKGKIENMEF